MSMFSIAVLSCLLTACAGDTGAGAAGAPRAVRVICTDSDSDAATLQHAIDSSSPGADISITGTCLLSRGITLLGGRSYTGDSTTGTVLRQGGRMSYVLASASYVTDFATTGDPLAIRDLTIGCDGSGTTDGIIVLDWQVDVQHVDVSRCGGSGIVDTSIAANGHAITNTSVNSRFDDNFITGSGGYGFEVADGRHAVTDGYLDGNQIASSAKDAIYLQTASGWDVSGNHLYGNGQDGISAARMYGTTISDNYIEDFGSRQNSGTWYGIVGTVQADVGSTISGNKISNDVGEVPGARHVYVAVTQASGGTGYLSVFGNVIVGARPGDIGFSFSGRPSRLLVASSGNEVARVGTARRTSDSTLTSGT
jgi:parallel beta-helix repeat protein